MAFVDGLINQIRFVLEGYSGRDAVRTVGTLQTISSTSLVLASAPPDNIREGSLVETGAGELQYVVSVAGSTLTVIRGWNGTPAAENAVGTIVRMEPTWIYNAIGAELLSTNRDLPR